MVGLRFDCEIGLRRPGPEHFVHGGREVDAGLALQGGELRGHVIRLARHLLGAVLVVSWLANVVSSLNSQEDGRCSPQKVRKRSKHNPEGEHQCPSITVKESTSLENPPTNSIT